MHRYGGEKHHFRVFRYSQVRFAIVLPEYLDRDSVIGEIGAWTALNNIALYLPDHNQPWKIAPIPYRVYIRVLKYPAEFWHPMYFGLLTAGFGEVLYADGENTRGIDRSTLRLTVKTLDPCLIPYWAILHYENRWTRCRVEVIGWEEVDPHPPGDHGHASGGSMEEVSGGNEWSPGADSLIRHQLAEAHRRQLVTPPENNHFGQRTIAGNLPRCIQMVYKPGPQKLMNMPNPLPAMGAKNEDDTATRLRSHREGTRNRLRHINVSKDRLWQQGYRFHHERYYCFSKHCSRRTYLGSVPKKIPPLLTQIAKIALNVSGAMQQYHLSGTAKWAPQVKESHFLDSSNGNIPPDKYTNAQPTHKSPAIAVTSIQKPHRPSILGPPPQINLYKKPTHTTLIKRQTTSAYPQAILPNPKAPQNLPTLIPLLLKTSCCGKMDQSDEELIWKFAGLQTESQSKALTVAIPSSAIISRNWDKCVLVKVISDRTIFDAQFEKQMRRAWGVHPSTTFTSSEKGLYLVECENKRDITRIISDGPWTYRDDLVIAAECTSEEDANGGKFTHAEVWVQFHNMRVDSLTEEGIRIITEPLGLAISEPITGHMHGKKFFRIKILIPLDCPVKDKLTATNPILGDSEVYLVYERVGRICCFCGSLGHDISSCSDRARLAKLKGKLAAQKRPELEGILKPTRGPWITNQTLVPIPTQGPIPKHAPQPNMSPKEKNKSDPIVGIKRTLAEVNRYTDGSSYTPVNPLLLGDSSSLPESLKGENSEEEGGNVTNRKFKAARSLAGAGVPLAQK